MYQSNSGELGTERSISIRSHLTQEATSGIIAQMLPNSGSSISCMEVSRDSFSRDGWVTLLSAFGSVSLGSQQLSISLCLV